MSDADCPELLHYYCSSSTLLSLVRNKSLWLTAVSLSNDRMEGHWAISRYLELFKDDRRGRAGARAAMEGALHSRVALGMCFSEAQDLLSQWRGYAADGRGICVSFKVMHLKSAVERLKKELTKLDLVKVDYLSFLEPETVKEIRQEFGLQIDQARKGSENDLISMSKDYGNGGHDRETSMVAKFFSIKNPAFIEEREWRLLLVDYHTSIPGLKFRDRNGLISPYVEVPIELDAVAEVMLGPLHPTPRQDVERMLSTFGVNAHVRQSVASYVVR